MRYDKFLAKRDFKEGDLVFILSSTRRNKLGVQCIELETVEKMSDTKFLVTIL